MSEMVELIKQLRDRTGAGLMDCKHALVESGNDIEKAILWLREKGIAKQAKKASRIAAEGLTTIKIKDNRAVVLEINCETDFVSKSDPFIDLVNQVAQITIDQLPDNVEELKQAQNAEGKTVAELFTDAAIKLGEKLDLRRFVIVNKSEDEHFGSYIHMKGAMSVLIVTKGGDVQTADDLAMCIASTGPSYLTIDEVSPAERAQEKAIQIENAKEDPSFAKKPQQIQEKIIEGRVNKHFEAQVFEYQEYVLDSTKTIAQVLKETGVTPVKFIRYKVGEGIEKRADDFAAEVAKELN